MSTPFKNNDLILFTGDSITDCGRNRDDPHSLGDGYVNMIAGRIGLSHPEFNLRFRNTGVCGDRISDLAKRWERDCLALRPDCVSVLAGVNNTLRRYDMDDPTPAGAFEAEYRKLLEPLAKTPAQLILCSPFLLPLDETIAAMRDDLDSKTDAVRRLAAEFDAIWVDFDAAFVSAQQRHIPSYWAEDGVHPSGAGHALMAETWLGVVGC